jgi:hypothetical protein
MSVDAGRRNALLGFSSVALGVAAEKSMKAIFGVLQHYQPKSGPSSNVVFDPELTSHIAIRLPNPL